jgi:hypothetical protein
MRGAGPFLADGQQPCHNSLRHNTWAASEAWTSTRGVVDWQQPAMSWLEIDARTRRKAGQGSGRVAAAFWLYLVTRRRRG